MRSSEAAYFVSEDVMSSVMLPRTGAREVPGSFAVPLPYLW